MNLIIKTAILLGCISFCMTTQCIGPKFSDVQTYVTKDAKINTETSYLVQFRLKCSNHAKNVPLFTEIGGNFITASSNESGELYQISWSENHKTARSGEINVRIFDEDGFSELKRAQRNNEDLNNVKELNKVTFNFSGVDQGNFIQYEFLIALLFSSIFYWAYSTRSDIQS